MYCMNCGKPIGDNAAVCPYCGKRNVEANTKRDIFGLFGFMFALASLFPFTTGFSIIAIPFLILGLVRSKKNGSSLKLSIVGLVLAGLSLIISVILIIHTYA